MGGVKWAGYVRVSRVGDRAERLISPELQTARIRAAAARHGVEVEILDPELDVSGGRTSRPILDRIIDGIEAGLYGGIVTAQVDRLSRLGLADAVATVERIAAAKGGVMTDAEGLITDVTPEGVFRRDMFLSLANLQLNRSKAGFAAAKRRAVEQGYWPTNTAPLGYLVEHRKHDGDGKLRPDPARRHLPGVAMQMRIDGKSWGQIADTLGVLGPTGWARLVRNRVYLGELRLSVQGEPVVNPAAHEPLVERALFEAAQLEHPPPARRGNPPALLAGLVRCAACGYVMSRTSMTGGGERAPSWSYVCRPRKTRGRCPAPAIIGCVGLDGYVEAQVLARLEDLRVEQVERSDKVQQDTSALAEAEVELGAFQSAVSAAGVGAEHVATGLRERVARVEDARRRLSESWRAQAPVAVPGDLAELWPKLAVERRRHVLRGVLAAVVVEKGRRNIPGRVRLVAVGGRIDDAQPA